MAEPTTRGTGASVSAFLNAIEDRKRRAECRTVARMMLVSGFERFDAVMGRRGSYTGKSCLYFEALDDVDLDAMKLLIEASVEHMKNKYAST